MAKLSDKSQFNYPAEKMEAIITAIYSGEITPTDLPEGLYDAIAKYLLGGVEKGFGNITITFGQADQAMLESLQENVYMFSAAKTFQQTLEMSEALVDDKGVLRTFEAFKDQASEIFVRYNGGVIDDVVKPGWIEAEYNTAIIQAGNAKQWDRIQKQKETFPYLLYNAVEGSCEICGPMDGVCLPVDDPFWDKNMPENHFNCRCIVEQVEREEGEANETDESALAAIEEESKIPDDFKYNPGKIGEVFLSEGENKHPYFSVPKEYSNFAKGNFDLPIPE